MCVESFNVGNSVCEGENLAVYDPAVITDATVFDFCCDTILAGAFYDVANKICTSCSGR